jgi:hypothetical protein
MDQGGAYEIGIISDNIIDRRDGDKPGARNRGIGGAANRDNVTVDS